MWTFREYTNGDQKEVTDWFEGLSEETKAAVLTTMEFLQSNERDFWKRPPFDLLSNMDGMGEVRLGKVEGVQTRLIGFFGPMRHEFTIVLVATKKGKSYKPNGWEKVSKKRREECESNEGMSDVWTA